MSSKEREKLEPSLVCDQESLNSPASISGALTIKPEKRKKKFVASLKSNIRHLGSSVGLKMSNQPKQGSYTDSTQSIDLKKKKNKKQKQESEERPSQSVDDRRAEVNPKTSKVAAKLLKRQSVNKAQCEPSVEQFTEISTGSTPPLTLESDLKSTSSSELSFDNSLQTSTSRDQYQPPLLITAESDTIKPLEELQTQQLSETSTSQSLDAEEVESENNSNKPYNVENEKTDSTCTISKELHKDGDKVRFESCKESDELEQVIESRSEESTHVGNMNETKPKEYQSKLNIVKDETKKNIQGEKIMHIKEDDRNIYVTSNPKSEVDFKKEENRPSTEREKLLMTQPGNENIENPSEKMRQESFIESERDDKKEIKSCGFIDKESEMLTRDINKNENKESLLEDIESDTTNTEKEINDGMQIKASYSRKENPELKSLSKEDEHTNEPNDTDKNAHSDEPAGTKNGTTDSSDVTPIEGLSENTKSSADYNTFPSSQSSLDEQKPSSSKGISTNMTQVSDRRECLYKILVIGELGTGKTSIIKRYVHQFFSQHYRATIGVDFALKVLNWDPNTIIRLQLWDIAGQERFGNMTRVYYKEAVGAFIVFDVTRSATFDAVLKWKQDLDAKVQLADGASIPCVLLANKCDQQKEGIVNNHIRMDEYCKEHNFSGWFETSAKENINIDEAAKSLVNQILLNDKVSQNGRDSRDASKFPLEGKGDHQGNKSCPC